MPSEICKTCERKKNCINGIWCSVRRQYVEHMKFRDCSDHGKKEND